MFHDLEWSKPEKTIAKEAYDKAYNAECGSILAEVKRRIANLSDPKSIWKIHDYLTAQRRQVDQKYDYRYSVLPLLFARLIQEKWLTEADLEGLGEEKLKTIRHILAF